MNEVLVGQAYQQSVKISPPSATGCTRSASAMIICVDHGLTGTNRISKQSPASALSASQWAGKLQRRAQNS